jgi:CelD/BcsL family acetyltransferase involved in cellulose biosynthesis
MSNRDDGGPSTPGRLETLFATPQWFEIWAGAFGRGNYGVWREAGRTGAPAVPYQRERVRIAAFSLRIIRGAANHYSPRYDVLEGAEDSIDLAQMLRDFDVPCADFYGVSEHSRLLKGIAQHSNPELIQRELFETSPFVDCTLDWDSYWASRGKNMRSNLLSTERKLRDSRVEILRLADWKDIEPFRETIYEIEASGWKGRQGTAMVQNQSVKSFYDRLLLEFSKRDLLRLFVLRIEGEVVAFELNTLYRGVLTALKGGFRESHAKLSPGQFLRHRFLPWAFAEPGVLFYDMLGPASETKTRWATGGEPLLTLRAFRRSFGGLLLRARYVTAPTIKACLLKSMHPRH